MMKKTIALVLALLLAFSMCACGEKQPEQNNPTEQVQPTEPVAKTFTAGTVSNNRYESAYAGIACELSSDWTFMTDAEIRANNELTMELIGDDYAAALAQATVVTDMFATHSNGMDTVNVTFEKLSAAYANITEEEYAEISCDSAAGAFESMGFADVDYEIGELEFAGSEHTAAAFVGTFNGMTMYELLVLVKLDGYVMVVTACTWNVDGTSEILAGFSAM